MIEAAPSHLLLEVGWLINRLLGCGVKSDMDLVAHPSVVGDSPKCLAWPCKNSQLVRFPNLPERIPQLVVLMRKSKLILHELAHFPEPCFFQIALFIPDQGSGGHSAMDAGELSRPRLFQSWRSG